MCQHSSIVGIRIHQVEGDHTDHIHDHHRSHGGPNKMAIVFVFAFFRHAARKEAFIRAIGRRLKLEKYFAKKLTEFSQTG